jgi:hypothetical protein
MCTVRASVTEVNVSRRRPTAHEADDGQHSPGIATPSRTQGGQVALGDTK